MQGDLRLLKACLNGKRSQADFPAVPVTPGELARDAVAVVAAGAEAVHLHARGGDSAESVHADDVGAAVTAVRAACPGTPVGVSTGLWITWGDVAARQAAVASWAALATGARPDFASVNVSEDGWAGVAGSLGAAGIAVEAGVWSVADVHVLARAFVEGRLPRPPLRILVEIMDEPAATARPGGRGDPASPGRLPAARAPAAAARRRGRLLAAGGAGGPRRAADQDRARGHHGWTRRKAGQRQRRTGPPRAGGAGRESPRGARVEIQRAARISFSRALPGCTRTVLLTAWPFSFTIGVELIPLLMIRPLSGTASGAYFWVETH